MFVRIKSRNNTDKKSVQIVKSFREGKKVKQKVIQTIGYAYDDDTLQKLVDVAEHLKEKLLQESQKSIFEPSVLTEMGIKARNDTKKRQEDLKVQINNLLEENRFISGITEAYTIIYDILGYSNLFTKRYHSSAKIFFQIVMARLAKPLSKRATVNYIHDNFGDMDINIDKVYRMMDVVDDKLIDKLQLKTYNSVKKLFNGRIKVAFYDCTTLYFESFKSDELKSNGYSKDGKFNQPQVLLALLATEEGLPLGYEVFPGNTFEGNTLVKVIEKLKIKYKVEYIVLVADSGLMSKTNLEMLDKLGYTYVIGARLRNMKNDFQSKILSNISKMEYYNENEKLVELSYENKRLVLKHSEKKAKKDHKDRTLAVEKLLKKLEKSKNPISLISNYGYKKYISYEEKGSRVLLNDKKLDEESKWDGLSGLISNNTKLSSKELLGAYKGLWQIESCFRVQKHDLKIRPIYHWTPKRIKAHLAISYAAFSCQQYLKYRLKLNGYNYSSNDITNSLCSVESSIVYDKTNIKKRFVMPSKLNKIAKDIYHTLRLPTDRSSYLITS